MSRFRALIVASVVISLLAGCQISTQGHANASAYLSAQQATEEYKNEAKRWELAPGHTWQATPYATKFHDGKEVAYERGIGRHDASFDWWCSWAETLLDAPGDEERDAAAHQVLRIHETSWYTEALVAEDKEAFDRDVFYGVQNGNYSGITAVVKQSCVHG